MDKKPALIRTRRFGAGLLWGQWLTVLVGIVVIAATVVIGDLSRRDATHAQRVAVLSQRVSAASQELDALTWRLLAQGQAGVPQQPVSTAVQSGFAAFKSLSHALAALRTASVPGETAQLDRDAQALYTAGTETLKLSISGGSGGTRLERTSLLPALDRLSADSQQAATQQQTVADQASGRASIANLAAVIGGFILVLLLSWWLHRMHRRAFIVNERRRNEHLSDRRIHALVEHASDGICLVDADLRVRWQSSSIQRMLGYEPTRLVGRPLTELVHSEDVPLLERHLENVRQRQGNLTFSVRFLHADQGWRHLEAVADNRLDDPAVTAIILSMRDVTDRKTLEAELRHQAFHDALTGLANRALFEDRLGHALAGGRRQDRLIAVLFLDVDDFKTINDSLGHASGDELLRAVALRIDSVVRASDTAARLGGDEFAVLMEMIDSPANAAELAARMLAALDPPVEVDGRELRISASVGVAVSDGVLGVDELLRNADTAMYAAKDSGKGNVQVFEQRMHQQVLDRLELTAQLRHGLEHEEFELDYQPIVELSTGRVAGIEALVRWLHPERDRLAPDRFIGLAEETGLIIPLGAWILGTAVAQAALWHRAELGGPPPYMSVNVSTLQLHDPGFPRLVADALHASQLDPSCLVVEMTESLLVEDSDLVIARLVELKALGIRIAVDDFGTGYSALSRLQRFPIDILKIDRSFCQGIGRDPKKAQLVRGIINLADSLRLEIVAEGIEEAEEAAELVAMQARFGQGFLFARPVSPQSMESLLREPAALGGCAPGAVASTRS